MLASAELVEDFETAFIDGEAAVTSFIHERMFSNEMSFYDPIHRKSRCSFGKPSKSKLSQRRVMKSDGMEKQAMTDAVSLAESQPNFSLSCLFESRVTEDAWQSLISMGHSENARSPS